MSTQHIEVTTKQGKLRGSVQQSVGISKTKYFSFLGVPYAKPPTGKLRFKLSQPCAPWEGVREAKKPGNDALQRHMLFKDVKVGNEDCLYLNVYTPEVGKSSKRAVMVWIHGGGFTRGSGSPELYGPDFLIDHGVVLVTINYRCGVFGFLHHEKVPGNLGLKDQTLALQWVKENIVNFGGDPNNVTIFGESAGGASVIYHLLSPLSKGLFHKAIIQSGSPICQWAFQEDPSQKTKQLCQNLGCKSQDSDKVLEFLMTVPAEDIIKAQDDPVLLSDKEIIHKSYAFMPCVEKTGNAPFLPDYPRNILERGDFTKVPILVGVNNKEGLLSLTKPAIFFDKVNNDASVMVPKNLNITRGSEEELKLGKDILKFYTNSETFSWDEVPGYVDFMTDIGFILGYCASRNCFLKHNTESVFTYLFSYTSPRGISSSIIPKNFPDKAAKFVGSGASHGDELTLMFKTNMVQIPFTTPSPDDQAFMNKFLKAWTTFAKTGNPNCPEVDVNWTPDSIDSPRYLSMGKNWKLEDGIIFPERMEFWDIIYKKYSYAY